jgi:predicted Zn-dependent protease
VAELGRLLRLHAAFRLMDRANDASAAGDFASAAAAMDQAVSLSPDDDQVAFRRGGALMAVGRVEEGRAEIEHARRANRRWALFLRRFAAAGFLPDDPAFLDAMVPPEPD